MHMYSNVKAIHASLPNMLVEHPTYIVGCNTAALLDAILYIILGSVGLMLNVDFKLFYKLGNVGLV